MEALSILYHDEWLVAVDKPAGYLVHPASEPKEDDLVAMKILRDQIGVRVNSIHRLDRPTSGVLLFGIEPRATKVLHKDLAEKRMRKEYLAVVEGAVDEEWECAESIQKEEGAPLREALTVFRREGEASIEDEILSLVRAVPHTGRFHQIRRHLLSAGHPIVGDYRYAGIQRSDSMGEKLGTGNQMLLQAQRLRLLHPHTRETLVIEAPRLGAIDRLFVKK